MCKKPSASGDNGALSAAHLAAVQPALLLAFGAGNDAEKEDGRLENLKALNEEGLSPRPSSAWVAFRDALLDQEDGDFAAQSVATTRENLDFMRHLRGAKVRDWRP